MLRINTLTLRDVDSLNDSDSLSEKYRLPTIVITPSSPSEQAGLQVHYFTLPEPTPKSTSLIPSRYARALLVFLFVTLIILLHFVVERYAEVAHHPEYIFDLAAFWSDDHAAAATVGANPVVAAAVTAVSTPPVVSGDLHHPAL